MVSSKAESLKKSSDFDALRNHGKRIFPTKWMIVTFKQNDHGKIRYGFTISSKVCSSVLRNRIKRWAREELRRWGQNQSSKKVDINVIIKPVGRDFFKNLDREHFNEALQRALKKIE